MDFKTFKEEVKENVRAHLPKEAKDVELSFGTYQKMNYSYEALFINIPEKNAQVSINLDELYEAYKDGQDLSKFYEIIPEIVESKEVDRAKEISFDYEQVKPHLFIRVDRVEGNENILENVPHCQMEDLALTYHVLLNKDGEGISKAMITNSWLEILGVTQEQLHQDALNNSQKLFPLSVMTITQAVMGGIDPTGVFASSQESLEEALKDEEIPLIVVTNKTKTDGAAALFYPEVMEQLGEKIGDFTILPSSTHETLILPDSEGMPIQHLKEMVAEVNGSFVEDADRLTDEVYHFDTKPSYISDINQLKWPQTMLKEEQFYQDKSNASENKARKLEEIMDELEQGVQSILTSENYMNYLKFLSSFHSYSLNNTILIYHQKPDASLVAGYRKWQSLGRQVRKGEKGIKIIAPAPVKVMTERQKIDSETGEPVKDENGNPVTEEASTTIPRFKVYEG